MSFDNLSPLIQHLSRYKGRVINAGTSARDSLVKIVPEEKANVFA